MRAVLFGLCFFAVCASAAPPRFLVEAELEQARIYVGGETILRLRLLRAGGVPYGVLRPPALADATEVWALGPVRWFQVQREGASWDVHERTYLLVPRRGGSLTIAGAEIEGPLRKLALPHEARALRGPQLVLDVRPVPAGASEPWLPARSVTLEESWSHDPMSLSNGSPVTRTIILRADGLPGQRLPQLEMAAHPALRAHHDRPDLSTEHREGGTIGRMIQRVVLMPLDDGEVVLPALSVQWWDIKADVARTTTLPGRTLRVQPAALPIPTPPAAAPSMAIPFGMALAVALLLVIALCWTARREPLSEARKQLRQACRANDPRAARDALVRWWKAASPHSAACVVHHIADQWDAGAQAQLRALDAALYGRRAWRGKEFWKAVRPWLRKTAARPMGARSTPAFFRLQAGDGASASDRVPAA